MSGLAEVLFMMEDRSIAAVMEMLEEAGVVRYDRPNDVIKFKQMDMSPEAFRYRLDQKLGRR